MATNLTAPQAPVTDEELDKMIWKLERDGGITPKLLSLMRELREVRKAKGEPVAWLYSASFERGHVEGEMTDAPGCDMPIYAAPPAPVVPDELTREEYKRRFMTDDCFDDTFRGGWNACRAAMLNAEKLNQPVSETNSGGWIPVSERMPENMDTVLTCNGFDIGHGWWDGESWQEWSHHDTVPGEITHWHPLPQPPREVG